MRVLSEPPLSGTGLGLNGLKTTIRVLCMIAAAAATASTILGVQALRRSTSARLALTLLAPLVLIAGFATRASSRRWSSPACACSGCDRPGTGSPAARGPPRPRRWPTAGPTRSPRRRARTRTRAAPPTLMAPAAGASAPATAQPAAVQG